MAISFTTYNLATGIFQAQYTVPNEEARDLNVPEGYGYVDGHQDIGNTYVDQGAVVDRPVHPIRYADLSSLSPGDIIRIDDIEPGSVVRGPGFEEIVDDGFVEWTSQVEGSFNIIISNQPFKEVILNATFKGV